MMAPHLFIQAAEYVDFLTTGKNSPPEPPKNHLRPDQEPGARGDGADEDAGEKGSTRLRGPHQWVCAYGPARVRRESQRFAANTGYHRPSGAILGHTLHLPAWAGIFS